MTEKGKVFFQRYGSMFRIWILRMILCFVSFYIPGFKTGSITKAVTNYEIPGASTKSSRLDVYAESQECVINIELQKRRDEYMSERIWQYGANIVYSFILRSSEELEVLRKVGWRRD